jgi:hypothetical protein
MNLITPKVGAKHELFFNERARTAVLKYSCGKLKMIITEPYARFMVGLQYSQICSNLRGFFKEMFLCALKKPGDFPVFNQGSLTKGKSK